MYKGRDYGLLHAAVHLACAARGPYVDSRCPLLDVTKGLPFPCTTTLDRRRRSGWVLDHATLHHAPASPTLTHSYA